VFLMVFTLAFAPTGGSSIKKAQAGLPVADWLNFGSGIFNWITNMWSQISQYASQALQAKSWYAEVYEKYMLPILKKMAIKIANDRVKAVIQTGNNGKPYIVTDWQDYMFDSPEKEARTYANSYLDAAFSGRDSSSYSNSAYYSYLRNEVENSVSDKDSNFEVKLDSVGGNMNVRVNMFADGNMKALNQVMEPQNYPPSLAAKMGGIIQEKMQQAQEVADKEQTNGYVSKKEVNSKGESIVVTPASAFENAYQSVSSAPVDAITNATKTSELLTGVVTYLLNFLTGDLVEGVIEIS